MKRVMVRYKVKADRAAENESYITRVFEQLKGDQPPGLRYASFKLDDGVSFVHLVSLEATNGSNPLSTLSAFKAFTTEIGERCEEPRFLELAPAQRSCVILKDVLEYSLDEIAAILELSVPAIKAALHRGRVWLRDLSEASDPTAPLRPVSPAVSRYAALFNARDWDGVRAMLVDDVKLDLVSRWKSAGRRPGQQLFHELRQRPRLAPRSRVA